VSTTDESAEAHRLNRAFMRGERTLGIKFRHNSKVAFEGANGCTIEGWIVAVIPFHPDPIYTIERSDGGQDMEISESKLRLLVDPHLRGGE
jgi:hypothetical protein